MKKIKESFVMLFCDRSEIKSRLEKTIKDKFNEYTITVIVDSEFS